MASNRLRNSCDSCTAAKLKCSRDRPSCSRCTKRSETCVYSESKRFGRARRAATNCATEERQTSASASPMTIAVAPSNWTTQEMLALGRSESYSSIELIDPSQPSEQLSPLEDQIWSDFVMGALSGSEVMSDTANLDIVEDWAEALISANFHDSSIDQSPNKPANYPITDDNTLANPVQNMISVPDASNAPSGAFLDENMTSKRPSTSTSLSSRLNAVPFLPPTSPQNTFKVAHSPNRGGPSSATSSSLSPPIRLSTCRHKCSTLVLEHLTRLATTFPTAHSNGDGTTSQVSLEHVEKVTTSVREMLKCLCSGSCDILALLTMTIFNVIEWYTAAVRLAMMSGAQWRLPSNTGFFSVNPLEPQEDDEEDQCRIFIQNVLSKLSGVQALITSLSQLLCKLEENRDARVFQHSTQPPLRPLLNNASADNLFNVSVLRSLCNDVRQRLRQLSRSITDKLG